jgi:hypothetical protein
VHLSGGQLVQGLDLKTLVWTRGCCCLHVSERFYNIAGEWFEDIHVDDDICTLLQQRCGRGLGYWGMVVRWGLHYLLEYLNVIQADTSLEFHDGQAFAQ